MIALFLLISLNWEKKYILTTLATYRRPPYINIPVSVRAVPTEYL